ncbi:hypothetical protein SAMN04489752_2325 [Brevibacterium siliguriense]|uniref:Uncharacterized protein n=1 Tax=Brevibacterium siliguriense TaxID=1136497 RepID=A0A1H1UF34_9MICO|nr:hypothetical protein SAMN04489752_2325 [Brevibacterium siliguriense]
MTARNTGARPDNDESRIGPAQKPLCLCATVPIHMIPYSAPSIAALKGRNVDFRSAVKAEADRS